MSRHTLLRMMGQQDNLGRLHLTLPQFALMLDGNRLTVKRRAEGRIEMITQSVGEKVLCATCTDDDLMELVAVCDQVGERHDRAR